MEVNNNISNISNIGDIYNSNIKQNNINNENTNIQNINTQNTNAQNSNTQNEKNNEKNPINTDLLDKAIEEANNKYKLVNKEFSYVVHEKTNRISVTIKDSESGKIINQIPSEEALDLSAKIKEMVGLLIDKKS